MVIIHTLWEVKSTPDAFWLENNSTPAPVCSIKQKLSARAYTGGVQKVRDKSHGGPEFTSLELTDNMRLKALAIALVVLSLLAFEVCEGRGSRGSRSSSRSKSNRSSRNSNSRSSSGTRSRSTPRTTKQTPIPAKTRSSSVIVSQTKSGIRHSTFNKVLVGYVALSFFGRLSSAPVYRNGYQMYGGYVKICPERAVRLMSTETIMLDGNDQRCLDEKEQNKTHNISDSAVNNVLEENMTITYGEEEPQQLTGPEYILRDEAGLDFEIVSRTRYNASLVPGEDCTVVEERLNGTVLLMYETNPNGAAPTAAGSPNWLLLSLALFWLTTKGSSSTQWALLEIILVLLKAGLYSGIYTAVQVVSYELAQWTRSERDTRISCKISLKPMVVQYSLRCCSRNLRKGGQ